MDSRCYLLQIRVWSDPTQRPAAVRLWWMLRCGHVGLLFFIFLYQGRLIHFGESKRKKKDLQRDKNICKATKKGKEFKTLHSFKKHCWQSSMVQIQIIFKTYVLAFLVKPWKYLFLKLHENQKISRFVSTQIMCWEWPSATTTSNFSSVCKIYWVLAIFVLTNTDWL